MLIYAVKSSSLSFSLLEGRGEAIFRVLYIAIKSRRQQQKISKEFHLSYFTNKRLFIQSTQRCVQGVFFEAICTYQLFLFTIVLRSIDSLFSASHTKPLIKINYIFNLNLIGAFQHEIHFVVRECVLFI